MAKAGDILHDMIETRTGMGINQSCSCGKWIRKMNKSGPHWCSKNIEFIVGKLLRQAKEHSVQWRAVPVDSQGGFVARVKRAFWKGAFWIPGLGIALEPFVRQMVQTAIDMDERSSSHGRQSQGVV